MGKIELTGKHGIGKYAIFEDEDSWILKYKWHVNKGYPERSYRVGPGVVKHPKMHREIMKPPKGYVVDHINGNKLDNRRENLRICTQAENAKNKRKNKNNTSGYKGVSLSHSKGKYTAYVSHNGVRKHIGNFTNAEEAGRAFDYYNLLYNGEYAVLNFPNDIPVEPVKRKSTSKYRGVTWCKRDRAWIAQISRNKIRYCLGYFSCEHEAARAYNQKSIELDGIEAILNVIEEGSPYE